jgi:hypothetical protein
MHGGQGKEATEFQLPTDQKSMIDFLEYISSIRNQKNGKDMTEKTGRILLANSKVPKLVYPTCLLGRQKSGGNVPKKKYAWNFEGGSPTVSVYHAHMRLQAHVSDQRA